MGENEEGATPTQEELVEWQDSFGLTYPVVADPSFGVGYSYAPGGGGLPFLGLIDRGMVVVANGTYGAVTDADVEALLE